jgi:hypothetical protein
MNDRKALRDRMAALPFAPIDSDTDSRNAHALGYIAYYLSTIEQHLGSIAESLARPRVDQAVLVTALKSLEATFQKQTPKPPLSAATPMEFFRASGPTEQQRDAARHYAAHHHVAAGEESGSTSRG